MCMAKSNAEGGDPRAIKTLLHKNLSVHFTITRAGVVRQHAPASKVAIHGPGNATSVGIELINPVRVSKQESKARFINKSEAKQKDILMWNVGKEPELQDETIYDRIDSYRPWPKDT